MPDHGSPDHSSVWLTLARAFALPLSSADRRGTPQVRNQPAIRQDGGLCPASINTPFDMASRLQCLQTQIFLQERSGPKAFQHGSHPGVWNRTRCRGCRTAASDL